MTHTSRLLAALSLAMATLLPTAHAAPPTKAPSTPYTWRNVAIVGGGFVDGFAFHPAVPGLVYARTDMGGAYRRDSGDATWQPLLDWLPLADVNLMGVESLALDPSDPDRIYLATGTYTVPSVPNGALLRSRDRGRSFERTPLPFKLGGNEGGRGNGERLAVDPLDGRVLFIGSRNDGLWRSSDHGASFQRVNSFPDSAWQRLPVDGPPPSWGGSDGRSTPVFVLFDQRGGVKGQPTQTIYVGIATKTRPSLWRSQDAGATWAPVPSSPTEHRPLRAALAADGQLYIAYASEPGPHKQTGGAVWRFDTNTSSWTDITPEPELARKGSGYAGVSVDAKQPQHLVVSSLGRPGGEAMFRSLDGGATWRNLVHAGSASAVFDPIDAPYVADTGLHWLHDLQINPHNPDNALVTIGYGLWETDNLTAADRGQPTRWRMKARGIEETVALALYSPTQGVPLVSAIGDYSGFVHTDLDKPAPGNPKPPFLGNTHDVTGAELAPNVMLRMGHGRNGGKHIGYSLDGGTTWQEPATVPDPKANEGYLAVSADGKAWIWTPKAGRDWGVPQLTTDQGASWTPIASLPKGTRVVADRVNPHRFHAMALFDDQLFTSMDGGKTFQARPLALPDGTVARPGSGSHNASGRGDDRGGQDRLYATPGREGDLWVAAFHGLYRAADGKAFKRLPGVTEIHAFGFGRAAPGRKEAAVYLMGTVHAKHGLFQSIDGGQTWRRINDDAHQWGLVLHVSGDPKTFGRVYVGTHGRGIVYGDPVTQVVKAK